MNKEEIETLTQILKLQQNTIKAIMLRLDEQDIILHDYNHKTTMKLINRLGGKSTWGG